MPRSKVYSLKTLLKDLKKVTGSRFGNYIGSEEEEIQVKQVKERLNNERLNNKKELLKLIDKNGFSRNDRTLGFVSDNIAQDGNSEWGIRVDELIKSLRLPITHDSTIAELKRAI